MNSETKAQLLERIKTIAGLTADERSALIGLLNERKTYGLIWEDKPEDVEERLRNELPVLVEDKSKYIPSDDPEAPNHILIEGDNLEALTSLAYTHAGKIDVIYIDPPYNTGNKDFTYYDDFDDEYRALPYVEKEDGYRHSKWLSFMKRRLEIAKSLLSETGVIFISIDENEIAHLRILGDSIFQAENFVGQWNWFKSATPPALSKKIKRTIEYILCWQGRGNDDTFRGVQKVSKSNDPFTKPQNTYKILTFPAQSITCSQNSGVISAGIYGTDKFPNELLDDLIIENGKNKNPVRFKNRFIWIQETLDENIRQGLYIELSKKGVLSYKRSNYNREVPPNLIDLSVGVDTTENAGRMLLEIFDNKKVFDYPKPVSLIKYLINFIEKKELTILDFFAGSGTTMHAVMQLNAEDGGHRQCILVTNNENGICENVTYERNKRVINGYDKPNGEHVDGLTGNSLRYYRTDFVSRDEDNKSKERLMHSVVDLLCIKNDLYSEVSITCCGRNLRPQFARRFKSGDSEMIIVFIPEAIKYIVQHIKERDDVNHEIKVYVFSPGRYAYDDDFAEVIDRVELCALPDAIYRALADVLPERRQQPLPQVNLDENDVNEALTADKYSYTDN